MIALAQRLTQQGFSVDFVVRGGPGPNDDRAREAGASVRIIGQLSTPQTPVTTKYSRRLTKHIRWITAARRERYDIVDAQLHPTDVFAALTRPLTRIPVVVAARLDVLPRIRLGRATPLLDSLVNRLTDVVVANAEITADYARHGQGVPDEKVRIIRGGVNIPPEFTEAERRAQRAELGAAEDTFLIGCVGTFRSMKRQDLLLDALARLLPNRPELRLVLVGDGEMRPKIEQKIKSLGLEDRVMLFGFATDLPPLYDAFDLFVQASNSEALPNVLLEASASRVPIVATDAGGTNELIHDGETGLLVPTDDAEQLAAAMHRANSDPGLRCRLGSAAYEQVVRDYGMDRFAREYADLYRQQLAASGARA